MSWYYEPDDYPYNEKELDLRCTCSGADCDYDEVIEVVAFVGKRIITAEWTCPTCGHDNFIETDPDTVFGYDDE